MAAFYEIWVNGEKQNPPEFNRDDADRRAMDIMSEDFFNQVEVRPIHSKEDVK